MQYNNNYSRPDTGEIRAYNPAILDNPSSETRDLDEDPRDVLDSPKSPTPRRRRRRPSLYVHIAAPLTSEADQCTIHSDCPSSTPFVSQQRSFELALAEVIGFLESSTGLNCKEVEIDPYEPGHAITIHFKKDNKPHQLIFIPIPEENNYHIRTNIAEKNDTILAMKIAARKNGRICLYYINSKETFEQYCQLMKELNITLELNTHHSQYQAFRDWLSEINPTTRPDIYDLGLPSAPPCTPCMASQYDYTAEAPSA